MNVEQRLGRDLDPGLLPNIGCQRSLICLLFTCRQSRSESGIIHIGFQFFQFFQVRNPVLSNAAGDEFRQSGIAEQQKPSWRNAVGLVAEFLRGHFVEVPQHLVLEQFGVQRRDTIDSMPTHRCQVSHADVFGRRFVDQRHAPQAVVVAGETRAHLFEKPPIDFVNDLQVPRKHVRK